MMKKDLLFFAGGCLFLTALFSCETDTVLEKSNSVDLLTKSSNSVNAPYFVNEDGALVFRTMDDYFALSDSIVKLSDEDYEQWTIENNFDSYRMIVQKIINDAVDLNEQEQMDLCQTQSDFVTFDENTFLSPVVKSQIYRSLINEERTFYIGEIKHVVNEGIVEICSKDEKIVQKINYCDISSNSSMLKSSDVIEYPTIEAVTKDGNRKVFTWFKLYKNIASNGLNKGEQIMLDVMVRPRKFVFMAGYKDYNDKCMVEEMKIQMEGIGFTSYIDETGSWVSGYNKTMFLSTVTSSKATPLFTLSYILSGAMSQVSGNLQDPICVHYRARIGDMDKDGAAYNTYHPMPGMNKDDCGHRLVTPRKYVDF